LKLAFRWEVSELNRGGGKEYKSVGQLENGRPLSPSFKKRRNRGGVWVCHGVSGVARSAAGREFTRGRRDYKKTQGFYILWNWWGKKTGKFKGMSGGQSEGSENV